MTAQGDTEVVARSLRIWRGQGDGAVKTIWVFISKNRNYSLTCPSS